MLSRDRISRYIRPIVPLQSDLHPRGRLDTQIECLLFDVYGTLFISESGDISVSKSKMVESEKIEQLLARYGVSKTPVALLKDLFCAIEHRHQALRQQGIDFPEVEIDRIWASVLGMDPLEKVREFAVEYEWIVNRVYPMPHLEEVISECKERHVRMGIVSNAQFYTPHLFRWFLGKDLKQLGFCPALLFFSYQFRHAKPSVFLFERAKTTLKEMDIPAGAVLYVGNDMLNDIFPAQKIGFKTALFAGDKRSLRLRKDDPRCNTLSPDLVITDLMQLLTSICF